MTLTRFLGKYLSLFMILGMFPGIAANAAESPRINSFKFSPNEIELTSPDPTVTFEITAEHELGIEESSILVSLKGPRNNSLALYLNRVENSDISNKTQVTFRGAITLPRNISEGSYEVVASGVSNYPSKGFQYSTGEFSPKDFRELIGAENSLIVRLMGEANISYPMFAGPTYDILTPATFKDSKKYNNLKIPIFRVGESFNPNDYFESYVPSVPLNVTSSTPSVCAIEKSNLKFISTGNCQFRVYTNKTKDYLSQSVNQSVEIQKARPKPDLVINNVLPQKVEDLPITLNLPEVYGVASGYVLPKSITPSICFTSGFSVKLISGGTCILTYQSLETSDYLASDLYKQEIEVSRYVQTITFNLPDKLELSVGKLALNAISSSGDPIQFKTNSTDVCRIEGIELVLIKNGSCEILASQVGTSIYAPASAMRTVVIAKAKSAKIQIVCSKGGKQVRTFKKSCPKGFKVVRK